MLPGELRSPPGEWGNWGNSGESGGTPGETLNRIAFEGQILKAETKLRPGMVVLVWAMTTFMHCRKMYV